MVVSLGRMGEVGMAEERRGDTIQAWCRGGREVMESIKNFRRGEILQEGVSLEAEIPPVVRKQGARGMGSKAVPEAPVPTVHVLHHRGGHCPGPEEPPSL